MPRLVVYYIGSRKRGGCIRHESGSTTGKPGAVLRKFCLPLFGSIIFQQLYNIADSFVAGKFIDNNALAAVGNGYEITLIFIAFAFGCNIGCSVLVSQLFGARQHRDMKTAVHTTLIASGVLCAVLMLVGFLCTDSLLRLIRTPEEILGGLQTVPEHLHSGTALRLLL